MHQLFEKIRKVDALFYSASATPAQTLQLLFSFSGFSLPVIFLLQLLFPFLQFFSACLTVYLVSRPYRKSSRESQTIQHPASQNAAHSGLRASRGAARLVRPMEIQKLCPVSKLPVRIFCAGSRESQTIQHPASQMLRIRD